MNNQKVLTTQPSFSALVQAFFTEYLTQQRAMSLCTVAAYRDTFVLFLNFTQAHLGRSPDAIKLIDITPELILAFLDHLEQVRHNTVRSRKAGSPTGILEVRRTSRRIVSAHHRTRTRCTYKAFRAADVRLPFA